jgi:hypothetical protein
MPLVGADDVDDAPAAHDLAVLADLLNRRTNFHDLASHALRATFLRVCEQTREI